MPRRKTDDDLFRESTMTFGEHLEELRSCLFRALVWLVAGFLIGLFAAPHVVDFIKGPLEGALAQYYKDTATEKLEQLEERGFSLPGTLDQLADLVAEEDLLPEEVYLQPSELIQQVRGVYENQRRELTKAEKLFRDAVPLLKRMQLPEGNAERSLNAPEREHVSETLGQLSPADFPSARDPEEDVTQADLDRILGAFDKGGTLPKDDLDLVSRAVELKAKRLGEDLARVTEGADLLDRAGLAVKGPQEELRRGDLARIFLWKPVENDPRIQTRALAVPEGFMIYIKAALLFGVLLASPGIFYQIWSFVAAGLYRHERRFVKVFGPFSLMLFIAGAALVYFYVFPLVLKFLFTFNNMLGIAIEPRISEWLGFALILPLGFGIAFQLPLVMLFLERIGVFSIQSYLRKWRIAILIIFVLSMLLTPADPGSMMMMAVPLTALYFGGILLCRYMPRSRSPYSEPED